MIIQNKKLFICDCIDNLLYEDLYDFFDFIYQRPSDLHPNSNYELEKIFTNLNSILDDDKTLRLYDFDFKMAIQFYNSYSSKYVEIDFNNMTIQRIKLLIRILLILLK